MRLRRPALLLLLLLASVAAAATLAATGCGIGGGDDEGPSFTTNQVVEHVLRRAGVQLVPSRDSPVGIDILQLGGELRELYGAFEVYVLAEEGRDETVEDLLGDAEPDERDVYWTRDQNEGWIANTRYGANVVLAWFDAPGKDVVDERWERLHELMNGLRAEV